MKCLFLLLLFLPNFYCDNYWMNISMPITAASYSDNSSECLSNIWFNNYTITLYKQYSVRCESLNDTCSAYIAIDHFDDQNYTIIFIAFRGTNNNFQFIENGWNYDEMVPFVAGGNVSKIFFDGFNVLWNSGMKDDLLTLKNKYYPRARFEFLGHSIGGAMASLAAATWQNIDNNFDISLSSFGQPRTGNKDFSDAFTKMMIISERFVHKADIVPHLPPLNQWHYYHHYAEIWYNNDMGINDYYVDCEYDAAEDLKCSNSLNALDYNIEDHKYYYGREFIEYGKNGCPDLKASK